MLPEVQNLPVTNYLQTNAYSSDFSVSRYSVREAVLQGIHYIHSSELMDDTDFFSVGVDSTTVAQISAALTGLGFDWANYGTIYKNPTIESLTARLCRGRGGEPLDPVVAMMFRLIEKYSNSYYRLPNVTEIKDHKQRVKDGHAKPHPGGRHVVIFHHFLSLISLSAY